MKRRFVTKLIINLFFVATIGCYISCSDLFENFLTEDETAKTGDDSVASASGNTDITHGLVVIKNSEPLLSQITYTADDGTGAPQKTYYVGTVPNGYEGTEGVTANYTNGTTTCLTGNDSPTEFRCYTNDAHASIVWDAVQVWESVPTYIEGTTTVNGYEEKQLSSVKKVTLTPTTAGDYTVVDGNLPYGVTIVTCTVIADDPQYSETYKVTLTKVHVINGNDYTATLDGLTLTPVSTADDGNTAKITNDYSFSPTTNDYTVYVNDDTDELDLNPNPDSGVTVTGVTYTDKYNNVTIENSPYRILLAGGSTTLTINTKDEFGNSRAYYVYIRKANDNDTSLKSLTYTTTATHGTTYSSAVTPATITPNASDMSKSYALTAAADNRYDLNTITFTAVQTHKYATLAYQVTDSTVTEGDLSTDTYKNSWTELQTRATQTGSSAVTSTVDFATDKVVQTSDVSVAKKLWIKVVSKPYRHSDGKDYGDTKYHCVTITKPADKNTSLTSAVITRTYQDGTSDKAGSEELFSDIPAATTVGHVVSIGKLSSAATGATYSVNTYVDALTFYVRALDKDAAVTYTAQSVTKDADGNYTDTENATEAAFTGRATSAASVSTEKAYNSSGYTYKTFTIGKVNTTDGATDDLPDGNTRVVIYVNGTATYTYYFVKPTSSDSSCEGLGTFGSGTGAAESRYEITKYAKTTDTFYDMNLYLGYTTSTLTVESCTQTEDANGAIDPTKTESYYVSNVDTSNAKGPYYIVRIGDISSTSASEGTKTTGTVTTLPAGLSVVDFYVQTGTYKKYYRLNIIKYENTENRLSSLSLNGTSVDSFARTTYTYTPTVTVQTGTLKVAATALSSAATVTMEVRYSSAEVTTFDGSEWGTTAETATSSTTGTSAQYLYAVKQGYYLITVTVTPSEGSSQTYKVIQHVVASSDATLSGLTVRQYASGSSGDYETILGSDTFKSTTTEYTSLKTAWQNGGAIEITDSVNNAFAVVSLTALTVNGTSVTSSSTLTIDATNGVTKISIPYSAYKDASGKSIVVTLTVTAEDKSTTKEYTASMTCSALESVTTTVNDVSAAGYSYSYNVDYTHIMAYRFGSVRTQQYTAANGYGGVDIIASADKGGAWEACSFALSGFIYIVDVDGVKYPVKLTASGTPVQVTSGVTLTVTPSVQYNVAESADKASAIPYVTLTNIITNTTGKTVKLGIMMDTSVTSVANAKTSSGDAVTIAATTTGFSITNDGYTFMVYLKNANGVDDVSTFWYGDYGYEDTCVFDSTLHAVNATPTDSAVSFSWNCGTDSSVTKAFCMSIK